MRRVDLVRGVGVWMTQPRRQSRSGKRSLTHLRETTEERPTPTFSDFRKSTLAQLTNCRILVTTVLLARLRFGCRRALGTADGQKPLKRAGPLGPESRRQAVAHSPARQGSSGLSRLDPRQRSSSRDCYHGKQLWRVDLLRRSELRSVLNGCSTNAIKSLTLMRTDGKRSPTHLWYT